MEEDAQHQDSDPVNLDVKEPIRLFSIDTNTLPKQASEDPFSHTLDPLKTHLGRGTLSYGTHNSLAP
jgi:hypothetical protein